MERNEIFFLGCHLRELAFGRLQAFLATLARGGKKKFNGTAFVLHKIKNEAD